MGELCLVHAERAARFSEQNDDRDRRLERSAAHDPPPVRPSTKKEREKAPLAPRAATSDEPAANAAVRTAPLPTLTQKIEFK